MNKPLDHRPETTSADDLGRMFAARSIAIIGASSDPAKIGGKPVMFLKEHFSGKIIPINPKREEIAGLPCKPDIGSVGEPVDAVIIALPAKFVEQSVRDCLAAGIKQIVLFSAGFGEIDAAGRAGQEKIAKLCRDAGARLLGPNSLGFINFHEGLFATFSAALDNIWPEPGSIGIASQSGAVGTYLMALMAEQGLGFSHFIATGNEADVDVADCVAWLADDENTKTIVAYLEGCRDGQRLRDALEKARRAGKPVIAIKPGATDSGQAAVQSHTGMLAGSKRVFDAVLRQCGAYSATDIEEVVDIAMACSTGKFPAAAEATIITPSGGVGIMLADECSDAGIELPQIDAETSEKVKAILPLASTLNPIDTTAQVSADFNMFGKVMQIVMDGTQVPIHFIFMAHMGKTPSITELLIPVLEDLAGRYPDKLLVIISRASDEFRSRLMRNGFLVFEDPGRAVRAVDAMLGFARAFSRDAANPIIDALPALPSLRDVTTSSEAAFRMLDDIGVASPAGGIAKTSQEAEAIAERAGYSVVLKIESPDIQHKSDVGGVKVAIKDASELHDAWQEMMDAVRAAKPDANIRGCLVSAMAGSGVDTIIGLNRDPVFGHVVAVGAGGIFTELLDDVAILPAPVSPGQARAMIGRLKTRALFEGARGTKPVDLDALANTVSAVSRLATFYGDELESLEINPYRATSDGGVALDVLVVPADDH